MAQPKDEPAARAAGGGASLWRATLAAQQEASTGLDGVLLLVAINRVLSPLVAGYNLYYYLQVLSRPYIRHALFHSTDLDSEYPDSYKSWGEIAIGGVIGSTFTLVFSLVLVWFFFRRRRAFPRLMVASLVLNIAIPGLILQTSFLAGTIDREALFYFITSAMWALIWVPYFVYSERVKNTFVR